MGIISNQQIYYQYSLKKKDDNKGTQNIDYTYIIYIYNMHMLLL